MPGVRPHGQVGDVKEATAMNADPLGESSEEGARRYIAGALFCLIAGVTWGAQFPIAGSVLKLIDPFYFTLLRYMAVSLILALLLIVSEGTKALSFEGGAKWV
jgi:drug/metabolite transporter (DMT)-like permease